MFMALSERHGVAARRALSSMCRFIVTSTTSLLELPWHWPSKCEVSLRPII